MHMSERLPDEDLREDPGTLYEFKAVEAVPAWMGVSPGLNGREGCRDFCWHKF